jgi:hypothetical protein
MKWKCKLTGNVIEFTEDHDNEAMKTHDGYELVVEDKEQPEVRRGRPPKEDK